MRVTISLLIIVAGLFGCALRNPKSREQYYKYTDSISHTQLDTSCLQFNRNTQLRINSRLKEFSFSPPDSAGRQYVERIVYATEEWGVEDSAKMISSAASVIERQEVYSSVLTGKEVVKQKSNNIAWLVIGLGLVSLLFLLWKTN